MATSSNNTIKISQLAKDFKLKNKEFIDLLTENGIEGKTHSMVLDEGEFSIILNAITKSKMASEADFFSYTVESAPAKAAEKKESKEKAEKTEKAEAKSEKTTEKTEAVKAEEKAEAKPEVKPEVKAQAPQKEAPKAENTNARESKPFEKKPFEKKPFDASKQSDRPALGDRKSAGDRPAFGEKKPYVDRNGSDRQGGFKNEGTFGARNNVQQGAQGGRFGSSQGGGFFGEKGQGGFGDNKFKKPQNGGKGGQGGFSRGGKEDDYDNQSVRQPSIKPVFDKDGRAKSRYKSENAEKKTFTGETQDGNIRLVDLRAGEVDLSKYDEKFENLAGGVGYGDDDGKKKGGRGESGSKGVQKGVGGRINRNESAARDFSYNAKNKKDKYAKKGAKASMPAEPVKKFTGPVTIPDEIMISDLAATLRITTGEVIKKLLMIGLDMASVGANKIVDFDTAYLVADELGIVAEKEVVVTLEEKLFVEEEDTEDKLITRSPVVCVMGHVDHGKTSLLDAIRNTHVTSGEAGGITQHIGAYRVRINDRDITFLDTPGHEAFTAMRARGAQATDIAILVVAADDGIMPQTVEAINHAKAAGIQIIVAINKMDKPGANPDKVKQELVNYELLPEDWGGDTICVPVSALKHEGIDELLEMVLLVADMKDLKANPDRAAKGIVIEAKLDKGRGSVATVLVQNGTLHSGDVVIAGMATGRVRAMTNDRGETVKTAGPSVPVEIIGLSDVPDAGDEFRAVADEKMARELVEKRKTEAKEAEFKANSKVSLEDLFSQINDGAKELTIIVKADVQGSAEAVKTSLEKLSNEEVKVRVIHSAVGGINEGDVMLADASNAIIVGFNVRPDKGAIDSAERRKVDVRTYRVIYDIIEEVKAALCGMLAPEFKEVVLGHAEVRQTIHVPGVGTIAGSYITDGKVARNAQIRVVRDGIVIFEDKISSLKRFKDDAKEVAQGYECGIGLERFNDIKEGDVLEAFIMEEVERKLESVIHD